MMRSQIPKFRLPDEVIDEEVGYALSTRRRIRRRRGASTSLKALLREGFDAIFVGCGAPRGRDLDAPGRRGGGGEHPHRHRLAGQRRRSAIRTRSAAG